MKKIGKKETEALLKTMAPTGDVTASVLSELRALGSKAKRV
jgi:hypothetical protein